MVMFPYMAEWLPDEEGEQLLLEFMHEMERLGHKEPPPLAAERKGPPTWPLMDGEFRDC